MSAQPTVIDPPAGPVGPGDLVAFRVHTTYEGLQTVTIQTTTGGAVFTVAPGVPAAMVAYYLRRAADTIMAIGSDESGP